MLPGFTASDRSTEPLRAFLRTHGYWVHRWGPGHNMGSTAAIVEGIEQRLDASTDATERRSAWWAGAWGGSTPASCPASIPEAVRWVITLGSPFRLREGDRSSATFLANRLARRFVPMSADMGSPKTSGHR